MPMSSKLLRPRTTLHPEATAWRTAVIANGGTVGNSLSAVDKFCKAIDAAGIRDRFYRVNLFCGSFLGALVPLYRGPAYGGATYGDATDTNNNFVSGDYVETGASGGLTGNGTSKYLNTGFATNILADGNRHLAAYANTWPNVTYQEMLGSESSSSISQQFGIGYTATAANVRFACFSNTARISSSSVSAGAFWMGVNYSPAAGYIYRNGSQDASGSGTAATPTSSNMFVFALHRASASVASDLYASRLSGYSIGLSMTATQAASYYTAMQAFQTALGRNV